MNTYEKCQQIRRFILNRAGEVYNYTNWDDEFAAKQIREIPSKTEDKIDVSDLTATEMDDLGFGKWAKEDPMFLIPLWLFPFLPDKIEAGCIDGEKKVYNKSEMDNDHRFGCLAYGVMPKGSKGT